MKRIQYSRRSVSDLEQIGFYTVANWGEDQARRYIDELETVVTKRLANDPELGRPCDGIRQGYGGSSAAVTWYFTGSPEPALWCRAFFISACCRKSTSAKRIER